MIPDNSDDAHSALNMANRTLEKQKLDMMKAQFSQNP